MEKKLLQLMELIASGRLSRNKHFDSFESDMVLEARRSHARVSQLGQIVSSLEKDRDVHIEADALSEGRFRLRLNLPKLKLTWQARLEAHEVDHLLRYPTFRALFES